jgi:hypothetical protein
MANLPALRMGVPCVVVAAVRGWMGFRDETSPSARKPGQAVYPWPDLCLHGSRSEGSQVDGDALQTGSRVAFVWSEPVVGSAGL